MDFAQGSNYLDYTPGTPEYERKKKEEELRRLEESMGKAQGTPAAGPVSPDMLGRFGDNLQQGFENLKQAPQNFVNNVQQLPGQFQQGLQNVQNMVRPQPEQQVQVAGPTQMPQQAQPAPQNQYSLATGQSGLGLQMPQQQPQVQAQPDTMSFVNQYQQSQDNPQELLKLGFSDTTPEWLKNRAKQRAGEILDSEAKQREAQSQLGKLNQNDMAKLLTKRSEGNSVGDWLQYLLYKHVGLNDLANDKGAQLGIGKTSLITGEDGTPYMIKVANNGVPLEGINATTGQPLTQQQLITVGAGVGSKLNIVGGSYINDKTGQVGRMVTDEKTGRTYIQTDTGRKPMTGFRPQSSTGSLQDMRTRQIQEINLRLQGKGAEEKMAILREYNQKLVSEGYPAISPEEVGFVDKFTAPQISSGQPAPAAPAPAASTGQPAPAASTTEQPAPAVTATTLPGGGAKLTPGKRPTASDFAISQAGRAEIIKKAGDVVAESAKIVTDLASTNKAIDTLQNKKTNFGTAIHGTIPGEQAIGSFFKTEDAINTNEVLDVVNKQAAINAKMLGTNPTDRDLQFVTSTKPNENWSPKAVEEWLRRSAEGTQRTLDYARKQIQSGGTYVPPTPEITGAKPQVQRKTVNGKTYIFDGKGWKEE
jgi:hypothetical protein